MIAATRSIRAHKRILMITAAGLLAVMAASSYQQSVSKAREAVLKEDLHAVRTAIDSYVRDKGQEPQSLADLISTGYLKANPNSPLDEY